MIEDHLPVLVPYPQRIMGLYVTVVLIMMTVLDVLWKNPVIFR